MPDHKYTVETADPEGYWLFPAGVTDPTLWVWMESPSPVNEIITLRADNEAKQKHADEMGRQQQRAIKERDETNKKMEAVAAVIREMTPVEKYDGLFDLDWMIPALGDLRATIEAKDAEIARASKKRDCTLKTLHAMHERACNAELRADAAEARVKELEEVIDAWRKDDDDHESHIAALERELADVKKDTARVVGPVKELRDLLGPDGDYAICSATEGEPSMHLVEGIIIGCVLEKIDAAIDEPGAANKLADQEGE